MPAYYDEKTKSWYCKFYYTDFTGTKKQKLKRGFQLRREAREWERAFLERQQGTPDMSFESLYNIYIDDVSHRLRVSTMEVKRNMFKNRILPYFKDKPVNEITPADIRKWQNIMIDTGYSDYYLNRLHNALTTVFNYAVSYFNLTVNPCTKSGGMGHSTRSLNFWTLDEYRKILQNISDIRVYTALQLLFYFGMRRGELFALTLADFDFNTNTISITKTVHHTEAGYQTAPPKTENGKRTISMPATIMEDVKTYCDKLYGLTPNDKLFNFSSQLIKRAMFSAAATADLLPIRIHDLRHSHVSLLIEMGFTPHLIADRIGDTVQMINNTYGHLYPNKQKEVAAVLDSLLVSK